MAFFTSCSDAINYTDIAQLRVELIDAPADYDKVIIDIQDASILVNGSWTPLGSVVKGKYDLLELTNGNSALLGNEAVSTGSLEEIRLVLGEENSLVIGNDTYELKTPSAQQSGLKIKVDADLEGGVVYTLLLDFDVSKSIVEAGNSGKYILKPVIRAKMKSITGSVSGVISLADVQSIIYAIPADNTESASAYPDSNGEFSINGLNEGTYTIIVEPSEISGKEPITKENVVVVTGKVTQLGTLEFN